MSNTEYQWHQNGDYSYSISVTQEFKLYQGLSIPTSNARIFRS